MRKLNFAAGLSALLCLAASAARAWDPNKPFIYEMKIAFETDNWINMYSTATVLSKSDNAVAFRVVANSTTTPTYQLVVTTQGNVGIGTAGPLTNLHVKGALSSGIQPTLVIEAGAGDTVSGPSLKFKSGYSGENWYAGQIGTVSVGLGSSYLQDMVFYTNVGSSADSLSEKVRITGGGNVGIGTTGPRTKLDINGDLSISAGIWENWASIMNVLQLGTRSSFLEYNNLYTSVNNNAYYDGTGWKYQDTAGASYYRQNGGEHVFFVATSGTADTAISFTQAMTITNGGSVGIGTTDPGSYKLYVAGTIYTSGGCTNCSDARWKTDISPIPSPLEKIMSLTGERFNWRVKEYPGMFFREGRDYGLIAQEVEKTLPELVYEDNGYKFIKYDRLPPLLIEAVKEQQRQIEELKAANAKLETANDRLEAVNKSLDSRLSALEQKR